MAEPHGVGDQVDGDDHPARDREAEDDTRLFARSPHGSGGPVHECRLCRASMPRQGVGHGRRAADLARCTQMHGRGVGAEHDIWVEQRDQRVEITAARGREEGVDNVSLTALSTG